MLYRPYGKTDEHLSIVGFGGIIVDQLEQGQANNYVAEAVDYGINYFDVAPSYGHAEDRLGPALQPYRKEVFLACKSGDRTKKGALMELQQSLKKLRTDYFDLYQLHSMITEEDFETAMSPDGALETLLLAREQGLVKYLGFSAHSVEIALKLLDSFSFDSALFPVNFVNWFEGNFGLQVVEKANMQGIGMLAIKAMAKSLVPKGSKPPNPRCWYAPIDDKEEAQLAFRYTLSQNVTAAIPPGDMNLFRWAVEAVENFQPVTAKEVEVLREYAKGREPIFNSVI